MSGGGAPVVGTTARIGGRRVGWGTAGPTHTPGYYRIRWAVRAAAALAAAAGVYVVGAFGIGALASLTGVAP